MWRECRQAFDRSPVSIEVRFWAKQKNRPRVKSVAGKKQTVLAIEQADGVGRVPGRREHQESAAAEVEYIAVVKPALDVKGRVAYVLGSNPAGN